MRVAITGAGLIGGHAAAALATRGHDVLLYELAALRFCNIFGRGHFRGGSGRGRPDRERHVAATARTAAMMRSTLGTSGRSSDSA